MKSRHSHSIRYVAHDLDWMYLFDTECHAHIHEQDGLSLQDKQHVCNKIVVRFLKKTTGHMRRVLNAVGQNVAVPNCERIPREKEERDSRSLWLSRLAGCSSTSKAIRSFRNITFLEART